LHLGAVYGFRIKGNYERLTHALARHRFVPVRNGLNRRTLVYDRDVGCAIEDMPLDGSLIQKELGFVPQYDLKTEREETIKEMKEGGAL